MKSIFTEVLDEFKTGVEETIDKACEEIPNFVPTLPKIEEEFQRCQDVSEYYLPISQLTNVFKQITDFDRKLESLNEDLKMPTVGNFELDREEIRNGLRDLLKKCCGRQLAGKVFTGKNRGDELRNENNQDYIPYSMRMIRQAVIDNDVDTFRTLVENPILPPKSIEFILKYQFPCNNVSLLRHIRLPSVENKTAQRHETSDDATTGQGATLKCSLWMLAAINCSMDIIRYLLQSKGVDLMEKFKGNNAIHYLLDYSVQDSDKIEQLVEDILQKEPKLVNTKDSQNYTVLELAIVGDYPNLYQFLIDRFGKSAQIRNQFTTSTMAVRLKRKRVFEKILILYKTAFPDACVHVACEVDWPDAIQAMSNKNSLRFSELLKVGDSSGNTPLSLAITNDSVNALKVIYDCCKLTILPATFQTKEQLQNLAREKKANKILSWLDTPEFTEKIGSKIHYCSGFIFKNLSN